MTSDRKIIILTPVKNEAWILDRFLQTCSTFADHIVIADQQSTDGSLNIYPNYSKVVLLENKNPNFNEAERQLLLLKKARELFGNHNILLALDADEILAANARKTEDWKRMLDANPGTVLFFEKPSLYKDTNTTIRFDSGGWPLGYIDDGADHTPAKIHSTRIPNPPYATKLYLSKVKFIHYNSVRLDAFASKQRMYSILENVNNSSGLRNRLRMYDRNIDLIGMGDRIEVTHQEWFKGWEDIGIDMHTIPKGKYYWYDYEALKLFNQFGIDRFAYDDIWYFDWESFRQYALNQGYKDIPKTTIVRPKSLFSKAVARSIRNLDKTLLFAKRSIELFKLKLKY